MYGLRHLIENVRALEFYVGIHSFKKISSIIFPIKMRFYGFYSHYPLIIICTLAFYLEIFVYRMQLHLHIIIIIYNMFLQTVQIVCPFNFLFLHTLSTGYLNWQLQINVCCTAISDKGLACSWWWGTIHVSRMWSWWTLHTYQSMDWSLPSEPAASGWIEEGEEAVCYLLSDEIIKGLQDQMGLGWWFLLTLLASDILSMLVNYI